MIINRGAFIAITVIALGLTVRTLWPVAAHGDEPDESLCIVTHVDVIPPSRAEGRKLLEAFATASRNDPGAVRIEIFEELVRSNHLTVVEVWKNRKSYDDHLALDHVKMYRTKLQPMLGSPFDERLHRQVK